MKACTVQQPHACALAAGWKPTENRGHTVKHRGEFAIHSGLAVSDYPLPSPAAADVFEQLGGYAGLWRAGDKHGGHEYEGPPLLALGAVIAVADLVDVHPAVGGPGGVCCSPWGQARHGAARRPAHHLVLANVRALSRPVPCRGNHMVPWDLPADVETAVRAQLAAAPAGLGVPTAVAVKEPHRG